MLSIVRYNSEVKLKRVLLLIGLVVLVLLISILIWQKRAEAPAGNNHQPAGQTQNTSVQAFDKNKLSLTEPTSLWVVVNKQRALPSGYAPRDLVVPKIPLRLGAGNEQMKVSRQMASALEEMVAAAKKAGVNLMLGSGYRSYALQKNFYNGYVAKDGQAAADRYSARPGHSEHQTGLSLDIDRTDQKCHLEECFGDLAEGKWLAEHAHEHGFILRYLPDKESITGYQYEPWHFRYVGKELAVEMYNQKITTLEEFFSLPPAPDY